jgi:hypothetical protein
MRLISRMFRRWHGDKILAASPLSRDRAIYPAHSAETMRFAICSLSTNCPFRISDREFETRMVSQISFRKRLQTCASAVSPWLCLAGDGCASYPLAATVWSKFLPLVVPTIPRGNKKPVPSPSSAVLRPNKPTPKSITFWGPRGVQRVNTPALKQPSRPR